MKKLVFAGILFVGSTNIYAESGFSVSGLLGSAKQTTEFPGFEDTSGSGASIGIRGAYHFNDYFALELAHNYLGEIDDSYVDDFGDTITETITTTALSAGVKGSLPINERFSLLARLGYAAWDWEIEIDDSAFPGESFSVDDDGSDPYYGLGAQYAFTQALIGGIEYTVFDMDLSIGGGDITHKAQNLSLSLSYSFR